MLKGVIYARYSPGPNQTDRSIDGQVADAKAFAASKNIEIIGIYADKHVSGKSMKGRDEFKRMLSDAEKGLFDVVVAWKIDRLGRDRYELAVNKMKLKKAGVKLMYAEESIPEGPEGIILESVLEGLAEYYSADLAQKINRGVRENAKNGIYNYKLPMGYKRDDNRHVIVDTTKAPLIAAAFELFVSGAMEADLIRFFNENFMTGETGKPLSKNAVYRMLRNHHYLGHFDVQGIPIDVEPIISEDLFLKAQERLAQPKRGNFNGAKKAKVKYLLSCKCYCGYCGALVNGESGTGRSGKVYNYYKCGTRKNKGELCELKPIQQAELEDAILRHTIEDMLSDEVIERITDNILKIQEKDDAQARITSMENELRSVRRKIQNTADAIADGAGKTLIQLLATLEQREEALQAEISRAKIKAPRLTRDIIKAWLLSFRDGDLADADFCDKLVETFIHHIELKNGEALIYYNASNPITSGSLCSSIVTLVDLRGLEPRTDRL